MNTAQPKIRYYTNEATDDFSGIRRTPIRIDASYRYLHKNPLWKLVEFLVYRVIMTPIAALWCRIRYRARIVGKEKLRACGKFGCFLYGNHTLMDGDAFLPSLCSFPKKTMVVVNADNLSVPLTRRWIELCGAIPVPNEASGTRHFLEALEKHTLLGHAVMIYPEAHLWPYCPFIRDFSPASFRYPVRFGMPSFAVTVTCRTPANPRRRHPDVTVYIDGPFYADPDLSDRERAQSLRDMVRGAMLERAENTNYEKYRYVRKEATEEVAP